MRYKITWQYPKGPETPLAEFNERPDADFFVSLKIALDEKKQEAIIYRLYDEFLLIQEFNKENIKVPIAKAQYADDELSLPRPFLTTNIDIIQSKNGVETLISMVNEMEDARDFCKANIELSKNNTALFLIYMGNELKEKFDSSSVDTSSRGQKQASAFKPTPFSTTLTMGPKKWLVDEEKEKKKDKDQE